MRPALLSAVLLAFTVAPAVALPAQAQDDLALVHQVAEANNAFGVALYREFAKAQSGNLVFSPFSLSSALALTATGARGQTEKELWKALRLDLPRDHVAAGYAGIAVEFAKSTRDEMASLTVANSLWPRHGYALNPEFLDVARRQFGAEVMPVDYAKPDAAAAKINGWINVKTAGLIQQLVDSAMLAPETRLTLCNAVHFKAAWDNRFPGRATKTLPFTLISGKRVKVPTMRQEDWFQLAEDDEFQLVRLPYAGRDFDMLIVLPKTTAGLGEIERILDAARVARWTSMIADGERAYLLLELPRFKCGMRPNCMKALDHLGVKMAFKSEGADFSRLSIERGLAIGNVLQKAVIDVNEEGTEAAAATVVLATLGISGMSDEPVPFKVDHPFLFFIRETRTGAILFMGRIVDPRAE